MGMSKGPGRVRRESPIFSNLAAPLKVRLFNYDVGSDMLKKEHRDWLAANVVPVLRCSRNTKVELRGTASRTGSDQFNLKLSEQRARGIVSYLEQNGVPRQQITFRGLGESPARADGKRDETETDEDRAVLVDIKPPASVANAHFDRLHPTQKEDGFDPLANPGFLMVPALSERRTLQLINGESLRLRSSNPLAVQLVDPATNRSANEVVVCKDPTTITFEGHLPGSAFIIAEGVNGGTRQLLEVHSLLHRKIDIDFFIVKDSKNRLPVNRSRDYVEKMVKEASKLWRNQANVSFRVNKLEQLDIGHDLGVEVTNKETSAGKNFHILSDKIKNPGRITIFLVWEWNPDDGNADAEVDKIGGKFIIFEDKLVAGSSPGRVLGHEIGHLFTLKHDDVVKDVLMFGGIGLSSGRLRKDEILKARKGI